MKIIRVGTIGAGFMCKLHSIAFVNYPMYFYPPKADIELKCVSDIDGHLAQESKKRFKYESWSEDWKKMVNRDDIDLIDIVTPNWLHYEMVMESISKGKNVFCEKPLANTIKEAKEMHEAAKKFGVINAVGYNNRCIPAVRLAKQLIDEGKLGEIYNYRSQYMQDWALDPAVPMEWRLDEKRAGSGALGDIGSHAIDLARFLVGDAKRVIGTSRTLVKERPIAESTVLGGKKEVNKIFGMEKVTVDDTVEFIIDFKNGAKGIFQASRFAPGHKNTLDFEIYGSKGAIKFTNEYLWELQYYDTTDPDNLQGYKKIKLGPQHPYGQAFWPIADLGIGYADLKCAEISHIVEAVAERNPSLVSADFYDGYKVVEIIEAIKESSRTNEWVIIKD